MLLECDDAYNLLVEFARSVVETLERPKVGLVAHVMLGDGRVREVLPVVPPQRSLVWRPPSEAMDKDNGVIVFPKSPWQVVVANQLGSIL